MHASSLPGVVAAAAPRPIYKAMSIELTLVGWLVVEREFNCMTCVCEKDSFNKELTVTRNRDLTFDQLKTVLVRSELAHIYS